MSRSFIRHPLHRFCSIFAALVNISSSHQTYDGTEVEKVPNQSDHFPVICSRRS
jgi:hypothetical protein